jgi:hypothetical protein
MEPLPGSKMPDDQVGARVYVLVPEASKSVAKKRLLEVLNEDKYRLVRAEFLKEYKNLRWKNPEDEATYDRLAKGTR